MVERNDSVRFLFKPLQPLGVAGKARGQDFKRSLAARCNVGGEINFAHSAGADRFRNFVVADGLADERLSLPSLNNLSREPNR